MEHVDRFGRNDESLHLRTVGFGLLDRIKDPGRPNDVRLTGFDQARNFDHIFVSDHHHLILCRRTLEDAAAVVLDGLLDLRLGLLGG